uniref:VWFA domain-containing protein n=1 Tax=Parastrongyloides trichosuri TaxID=131310 RepID=A0A0N4Z848_PARTI
MNKKLLWLLFVGVPVLALSGFLVLLLILKGTSKDNSIINVSTSTPPSSIPNVTTITPKLSSLSTIYNNGTITTKIETSTVQQMTTKIETSTVQQMTTSKYVNNSTTTILTSSSMTPKTETTYTPTSTKLITPTIITTTNIPSKTTTEMGCSNGEINIVCENDIIFSLDASSDILNPTLFQKEIDAIQNTVIYGWSNFSQIALTWYNKNPYVYFTFGTISKIDQFIFDLTLVKQDNGSSISNLFKSLDILLNKEEKNANVSTFVFVSQVYGNDILDAMSYAPPIKESGTLNIIVIGDVVDINLISLLDPDTIFIWDLSENSSFLLANYINEIRGCKNVCSQSTIPVTTTTQSFKTTTILPSSITTTRNIISTSTTTKKETTLSTTSKYVSSTIPFTIASTANLPSTTTSLPCNNGYLKRVCDGKIIFTIDSTNDTLSDLLYSRQLELITSYIEPLWDDYKKIALSSYNALPTVDYSYGMIQNKDEFNDILFSIKQSSGSSLSKLLSSLNNIPEENEKISTIIFISELNDNEIELSQRFAKQLQEKGSLSFIILGNVVKIGELKKLDPVNVFKWDFTYSQGPDVASFINNSLICREECIKNGINHRKIKECQNNKVLVTLDTSNKTIPREIFKKMIKILRIHFLNENINFSNVGLTWYNEKLPIYFPFNSINTRKEFVHDLSLIKQGINMKLSKVLKNVLMNFNEKEMVNENVKTIIFVSDITPSDVLGSLSYIKQLKKYGDVNIIILGNIMRKIDLKILNVSKVFIWDFSYQSTNNLFGFLKSITHCDKEKDIISTTTTTTEVFTTDTTTTTQSPCTYGVSKKTCDSDVYITVDSTSDSLSIANFNKQITILQNNISNIFTDFRRISLTWYDDNPHLLYPISKIENQDKFNGYLSNIEQNNGSKLSKILNILNSMSIIGYRNISSFIYISEITFDEAVKSISYVEGMKSRGTVNFIALESIDRRLLDMVNPSNVYYWDFTDNDVNSLVQFYNDSMSCDIQCNPEPSTTTIGSSTNVVSTSSTTLIPTTTLSTTMVMPTTTTQCPGVITKNCNNNIIFAVDASNNLQTNETFMRQKSVIRNNLVTPSLNFSNVILSYYNQYALATRFNFFTNTDSFNQIIDSLIQSPGWKLSSLFEKLINVQRNNNNPIATFIFVSQADFGEINNSINDSAVLESFGTLNFILLGSNIDGKYFSPLNPSNIFEWDLSDNSIPLLVDFFYKAQSCEDVCVNGTTIIPTTSLPSIVTSTSVPLTSTQSSSIPTSSATSTSTIAPSTSTVVTSTTTPLPSSTSTVVSSTTTSLPSSTSTVVISTTTLLPSSTSTVVTSTSLSPVTTTQTIITSTTLCPGVITKDCNNNLIFVIDASSDLQQDINFKKQISVIENDLVPASTNYNNIAAAYFNSLVSVTGFNIFNNKNDFITYLNTIQQNQGWSLSLLFQNLKNINKINDKPISTFIFVSEENVNEINKSISDSTNVESLGSLNIILMGDALESKFFTPLNPSNIFTWDMSDGSIPLLSNFIIDSQVCVDICNAITTTPPGESTTTILSSTDSSTMLDTTEVQTTFSSTGSSTILDTTESQTTFGNTDSSETLYTTEAQTTFSGTGSSTILDTTESQTTFGNTDSSDILYTTEAQTTFSSTGSSTILDTTESQTTFDNTDSSDILYTTEAQTTFSSTESSTILDTTESQTTFGNTDSTITTSPQVPSISCSNNIYIALDGRKEVTDDLFTKETSIFMQIANYIDVTKNKASLDINYNFVMTNILFPIQPKDLLTLYDDTQDWDCVKGYISNDQQLFDANCKSTKLVPFTRTSPDDDLTLDNFLKEFSDELSAKVQNPTVKLSTSDYSTLILFTLTGSQQEIDDSGQYFDSIELYTKGKVHIFIVKLSSTDNYDYSRISANVFDFSSSDLINNIFNAIC